jgi:hypothetical protein
MRSFRSREVIRIAAAVAREDDLKFRLICDTPMVLYRPAGFA